MRRYGFTGARQQPTFEQATSLRFWLEGRAGEFHHGDCIGSDEAAHDIVHSLRGWRIVVHPGDTPDQRAFVSDYDVLRPVKPNLERNSDIVSETDELVATPSGSEIARSGTWSTIRKARRAGKPLTIIWPDGTIEVEGSNPAGLGLSERVRSTSALEATDDKKTISPRLRVGEAKSEGQCKSEGE